MTREIDPNTREFVILSGFFEANVHLDKVLNGLLRQHPEFGKGEFVELNEPRNDYKRYPGNLCEQMPLLLKDGRKPAPPRIFMERRLYAPLPSREIWRYDFFITSTSALTSHDAKEVKFVHDHPFIYTLGPDTKLADGKLLIAPELYGQKDGFVFTTEEILNDNVTPKRKEAFWEFLAEGDSALARDYSEMVKKVGRNELNMRRHSPEPNEFRLGVIGPTRYHSNIYMLLKLDARQIDLVGVKPEVLSAAPAGGSYTQPGGG